MVVGGWWGGGEGFRVDETCVNFTHNFNLENSWIANWEEKFNLKPRYVKFFMVHLLSTMKIMCQ